MIKIWHPNRHHGLACRASYKTDQIVVQFDEMGLRHYAYKAGKEVYPTREELDATSVHICLSPNPKTYPWRNAYDAVLDDKLGDDELVDQILATRRVER